VAILWGLAALWLSFDALGQAPGPELFAKPPTTPLELWDAADYLVRTGQAAQAIPYLNAFLQSQPDDDTLLAIRDRYGVGSVLRLDDDPRTQPIARKAAEMFAAAQKRNATRPDRIARFIAALSKTRPEQDYAVERLHEAGPYAVPFLVQTLQQPGLSAEERALIVHNMGRLDSSVVPPLIATLESADLRVAADAASALGVIGDRRAIPQLTAVAARGGDAPDPARDEARKAIVRLTGRHFAAQPRSPIRVLTDEAIRYHLHCVAFPAEPFIVWTWDAAQTVPVPTEMTQTSAEAYFGLGLARAALQLDPSYRTAQVVVVSIALEKAVERGVAPGAAPDPSGVFARALAAGPDVLGWVVLQALVDHKYDLAAAAITALGQVTDRTALQTGCRPNPLVAGLTVPSRRVQFAAARALVMLEPRRAFAGSSQVVPVLARFVASESAPRAVVIDGNTSRGGQLVGFLKELGYDPMLARTGDEGFRTASESADVELILIDNHLVEGAWRLTDTLANLCADARTAGVPTYIVGPKYIDTELNYMRTSFPGVKFLVTPTNAAILERQLGGRPAGVSEAERGFYARESAGLLALIAGRPGSPFEPELQLAEPALMIALNQEASALSAASTLSEVAMPDAQRGLGDLVLDPARPVAVRVRAAGLLARSIQRFGPLLAADQEARLLGAYDQEADPTLKAALANDLGALRPRCDLTGRRLQQAAPVPVAAPPTETATPTTEATSPASETPSPAPPAPEGNL
jgi:hypothetical protein